MIDFSLLTLVDYAILFVLILSALMSILRGLTREILGLVGWGVSIVIANYSAPLIEKPLIDFLQVKGLSAALAWGLPFGTSVVFWFIFASIIAPGLKRIGLGSFDRWFGVLFGFIRGFGLVLIVFVVAIFAAEGENKLPDIVTNSQSTPLLSKSAHYFSDLAPKEYRERLKSNLSYSPPINLDIISKQGKEQGNYTSKSFGDSNSMNLLKDEKSN